MARRDKFNDEQINQISAEQKKKNVRRKARKAHNKELRLAGLKFGLKDGCLICSLKK